MRFTALVVVACAFVAAHPVAHATSGAQLEVAVHIVDIAGHGVVVTWAAPPLTLSYRVFRGASLDQLELIGTTNTNAFLDPAPPIGDAWYVIKSEVGPSGNEIASVRGACVNHRGATGISVTVNHCVPGPLGRI